MSNYSIGGLVILAQLKEFVISLPDSIIEEVDNLAISRQIDRSEVAAQAIRLYLREQKKRERVMRLGYAQMAEINLEYANTCLAADNETLNWCEEKLAESE